MYKRIKTQNFGHFGLYAIRLYLSSADALISSFVYRIASIYVLELNICSDDDDVAIKTSR